MELYWFKSSNFYIRKMNNELKNRLENKLKEIAEFLLSDQNTNTEIGALEGIAGNALFHFYYGDYKSDKRHTEKGAEIITEAFTRIENGYTFPTFCDGIAGACWVLELLKQEQFVELEEDIITEDVDTYLFEKMKSFIDDHNFDFLHGAIGIGMYYLKRYQNTDSNIYVEYLAILIDAIIATALKEGDTIKWESKIKSGDYTAIGCNLGLAHGIPSIIFFLSKLAFHKVFVSKVIGVLEPASKYLLSCKFKDEGITASFPNWIINEQPNANYSRLAWCYGDLGIGVSLLRAAEVIKNEELSKEAIRILEKTSKRRNLEETKIRDIGLCHGSFGVMNIYNLISNVTVNDILQDATTYWAKEALDMTISNNENTDFTQREINILDGAPGVGLAILSYLDKDETIWEEVLLIK